MLVSQAYPISSALPTGSSARCVPPGHTPPLPLPPKPPLMRVEIASMWLYTVSSADTCAPEPHVYSPTAYRSTIAVGQTQNQWRIILAA